MSQVIAFLIRLVGLTDKAVQLINQIISIVTGIQNALGTPAQQHSVDDVLTDTDTIITMLNDPSIGLAWIAGEIDAQAVGILAAIAALPQVGDPVTLPTVPPTGYGGADVADIVDQVWNDGQAALGTTPSDTLLQIARSLNTTADFDMPLYSGIFQVSRIDWGTTGFYLSLLNYPLFDPSDILITEDFPTCLARQNPTWNIGQPWFPQTFVGLDPTDGSVVHYTTTIDELGFQALKAAIFPPSSGGLPPVWPGLAEVTLGTPVAIASQLTVAGPMDGCIITITSVTTNKPSLAYDTQLAYKFIGGLAFVDDNGDVEPFQTLAFTNGLYSPQRMTRATSVVLRTDPGVVGTVTPWVIA